MATLAQIRGRVQRNLDRLQVTDTEDSDLDALINEIIREDICADHNWASMEAVYTMNVTASTSLYAWPNPDNFKDCEWMKIRSSSTSEYTDLTEEREAVALDASRWTEQTESKPMIWARSGNAFRLRPIPDVSTYQLRLKVWEYPGEMTTDASTNWFTVNQPKLVIIGATYLGTLYYGETQDAQIWQQMYMQELGKAVGVDKKRLSPANPTMKPGVAAGYLESSTPGPFTATRVPYDWM